MATMAIYQAVEKELDKNKKMNGSGGHVGADLNGNVDEISMKYETKKAASKKVSTTLNRGIRYLISKTMFVGRIYEKKNILI